MVALLFMQINMYNAMSYGKVFPTNIQGKTTQYTSGLIVKDVSKLAEYADIVSHVEF